LKNNNLKKNNKPFYIINTWYGSFDSYKIENDILNKNNIDIEKNEDSFYKLWEKYFEYIYKMSSELDKKIHEKYNRLHYEFNMSVDDYTMFYWGIGIEYDISKELLNEIIKATEKVKKSE
jgi:hypothetical protein